MTTLTQTLTQTVTAHSPASHLDSRYTLFTFLELEKHASEIYSKLHAEEQQHLADHPDYFDSPDFLEAWQQARTRSLASVIAKEQAASDHDPRWHSFPDLITEFMWGLYGLEGLLDPRMVDSIHLNGEGQLWVKQHGQENVLTRQIFDSSGAVLALVNNWIARYGKPNQRLTAENPEVGLMLPGGARLVALGYASDSKLEVSIRPGVFREASSLRHLVSEGTLSDTAADFLREAMKAKCNILIAGRTGAGKTSLLRTLLCETDINERVITVEEIPELGYKQIRPDANVVELLTRKPNVEGKGEISIADLVKETQRMAPDRVAIGEIQSIDSAVASMIMFATSEGRIATIHADSAKDALSGVAMRMSMSDAGVASSKTQTDVSRIVKSGIDIVVYLHKDSQTGQHQVREIICTDPSLSGQALGHALLFAWNQQTRQAERLDVQGHGKAGEVLARIEAG